MSPILTQATPWHLFIAYAPVLGALGLIAAPIVLALHRRGGTR